MATRSSGASTPARGQVWSSDQVFTDGPSDFLIISCDDWNRRGVTNVLGMEIEAGHQQDASSFASLIIADGHPMTVYGDQVLPIPKEGLLDRAITLDAVAMAAVDDGLDRALNTADAARPVPPAVRPRGHPYPGQIRFADLHIPDQPDKPVVVVSSESFGAELAFELVLACRVTSNPTNPHDFDVVLTSQTGKVVCSDLSTIAIDDLRERTTRGASAVSVKERAAIMAAVRRMVGLD